MSPAELDPESGCRIPLPRREDLDPEGQTSFDFYTSGTLRGLQGPAGYGSTAHGWLNCTSHSART
jgi:hypothetical protein